MFNYMSLYVSVCAEDIENELTFDCNVDLQWGELVSCHLSIDWSLSIVHFVLQQYLAAECQWDHESLTCILNVYKA